MSVEEVCSVERPDERGDSALKFLLVDHFGRVPFSRRSLRAAAICDLAISCRSFPVLPRHSRSVHGKWRNSRESEENEVQLSRQRDFNRGNTVFHNCVELHLPISVGVAHRQL
jgi:hypothetical protein